MCQVEAYFATKNISLITHKTEHQGHAKDIAETLPNDATILSLGGDGTLHEIVNACVHTNRTIAVIPAGSGDDFAYVLGLRSIKQALETVLEGVVTSVDCGYVEISLESGQEQAYFINSFGVGFDAEVGTKMQQLPKVFKGQIAYFVAVLWQLFSLRNVSASCYVDGELLFEGASLFASVQNGKRTGGGFYLTPQASVQDGLFDVVMTGRLGVLETLMLLPQTLKEQVVTGEKIYRARAKEVVLNCSVPRLAHLEGEGLKASSSFKARVVPKAIKVLIPKENMDFKC